MKHVDALARQIQLPGGGAFATLLVKRSLPGESSGRHSDDSLFDLSARNG